MPVNGSLAKWDQLHLQLATSAPSICQLQSLWTPNYGSTAVGVQLDMQTTSTGWTGKYHGPFAPSGGLSLSGSGSSGTIDVYFNNWRLYGVNPGGVNYLYHVFWDSITVYADGALIATLSGGDQVSGDIQPSYVPIVSGLVSVYGAATTNTSSANISGGWRYKIGSTWYAPPVHPAPPPGTLPSTINPHPTQKNAPYNLSYLDCIVSTSTFGTHIASANYLNQTFYPSGYIKTRDTANYFGTIWLIPNMPKSIVRMNSDFGATFFAFAVPQIAVQGKRQWVVQAPDGTSGGLVEVDTSATGVNHVAAGSYEVGNSASPIEGFFSLPNYAPVNSTQSKSHLDATEAAGTVHNFIEELEYTWPAYMESSTGAESWSIGPAAVAAYMSHSDLLPNYFNSAVCHPHWSMGYFTGPWTLEGSATNWTDYWGPIREQYMSAQKRRNHIVSCPLEESGYTPYLDAQFQSPTGKGMRWIGVSRWQTQNVTPPASLTLDWMSSDSWSPEASSCTLALGAVVAVTPVSSPCKFTLSLNGWAAPPYLFPQICTSIFLNWPTRNIASVKVSLVSSDGTSQLLFKASPTDTDTQPNHTYNIAHMRDAKYAGSWAIDNGDLAVSDTGVDTKPAGISAAVMADPSLCMAFGLLQQGQGTTLHFEVTPVDATQPFSINYPQFFSANTRLLLQENGQIATSLFGNGPSVRWGNHLYYSGVYNVPPLVTGLGYKGSIVDWLSNKRVLLYGVGPTSALPGGGDDLATELTHLFDSFEGQSVGAVDRDSIVFILPQTSPNETVWRAALVNTWSEVPPLAGFPAFDRDPLTWLPTTTPCQKVWALAQVPRRIANTPTRADLYKPDGTLVTSLSSLTIPGWVVTEHSQTTLNDEVTTWKIRRALDSSDWAHVNPWHGWTCVLGADATQGLFYDVSLSKSHMRSFARGGHAWVGFAANSNLHTWDDVDTGIAASVACARVAKTDKAQRILMLVVATGNILLYRGDASRVFTMPITLSVTGTSTFATLHVTPDKRWFAYWLDGTTIKGALLDNSLNVLKPAFTAISGVDANTGFDLHDSPVTGGGRRVGLLCTQSGNPVMYTSPDGIVFS